MTIPHLTLPTFPDVPIAIGVPPVFRKAIDKVNGIVDRVNGIIDGVRALTGDSPSLTTQPPQWGIFNPDGTSIVTVDNVASFEYGSEYRISDYPIEAGGFESYDKVATPYDVRFKMTRGGDDADRNVFFETLEQVKKSLDLYSVVTPEITYLSANITDVNYQRTATNGVSLITAEIIMREVRVTVKAAFTSSKTPAGSPSAASDPKSPSGADPVNDGAVQPQELAPAQIPEVEMT